MLLECNENVLVEFVHQGVMIDRKATVRAMISNESKCNKQKIRHGGKAKGWELKEDVKGWLLVVAQRLASGSTKTQKRRVGLNLAHKYGQNRNNY